MRVFPSAEVVVDTNFMLDFLSVHNLTEATKAELEGGSRNVLAAKKVRARQSRLRDAVLLAELFHQNETNTLHLHEAFALLERKVPPGSAGEMFEVDFTTWVINFVKERVLPSWNAHVPTIPEQVYGEGVDVLYAWIARDEGLPLITCEGITPCGIEERGLRAAARAEGIAVYSPREYFEAQELDEAQAIAAFLERFRRLSSVLLDERAFVFDDRENATTLLAMIARTYRWALLDELPDP